VNDKVVEIKLFQTLTIDGLSEGTLTPEYKASLIAAYLSEFPSLSASNIIFGAPIISSSQRRRLEGNSFEIPVTIETASSETNGIAAGMSSDSFAGSITVELASAGETISVQDQNATGMELLFSLRAETTSDIEEMVVNNDAFAAEIATVALANNIAGADATVVVNKELIVIMTLAPTVDPTPVPTMSPTLISCFDGFQNMNETDVDCGGACHRCDVGQACLVDSDCHDSMCQSNMCVTFSPTKFPSASPSNVPTSLPTFIPTVVPTILPTLYPTLLPTLYPTAWCPDVPDMSCGVLSSGIIQYQIAEPLDHDTIASNRESLSFRCAVDCSTGSPTMVPSPVPTVRPTTSSDLARIITAYAFEDESTASDSISASATWEEPLSPTSIRQYDIEVVDSLTGTFVLSNRISRSNKKLDYSLGDNMPMFTIDVGLLEGRTYTFGVRTKNSAGWNDFGYGEFTTRVFARQRQLRSASAFERTQSKKLGRLERRGAAREILGTTIVNGTVFSFLEADLPFVAVLEVPSAYDSTCCQATCVTVGSSCESEEQSITCCSSIATPNPSSQFSLSPSPQPSPTPGPSPRPTYTPSATPSLIPTASPFQVSATAQYPGYIVEATLLVTGISSEEFGADRELIEAAIDNIADEIGKPPTSIFFLGWTSTTTNTTDDSAGGRRRKLLESITALRISLQIIVDDFVTAQEVERRMPLVSMGTLEIFAAENGYTAFTAEMVPTVEVYPMKIPTSDIETDSNRCLLLFSDFSVPIYNWFLNPYFPARLAV
jgi:hypothetical protein